MKTQTVLAIGAHIGDAELTAGALLASCAVHGGKAVTLALTAGEKGAPAGADIAEYRRGKIAEAEAFAKELRKCKTDEEVKIVGIEWGIQQAKELIQAAADHRGAFRHDTPTGPKASQAALACERFLQRNRRSNWTIGELNY